MVLNFLNFSTLSQFFIVKLFYGNHTFLPSYALTLQIQMVFSLSVLIIYVFHASKIKKALSKKQRKHEQRKFAHENITESLLIIINGNWTET